MSTGQCIGDLHTTALILSLALAENNQVTSLPGTPSLLSHLFKSGTSFFRIKTLCPSGRKDNNPAKRSRPTTLQGHQNRADKEKQRQESRGYDISQGRIATVVGARRGWAADSPTRAGAISRRSVMPTSGRDDAAMIAI
ncbi:hypothetical protein BJY52DRAFT_527790 [Lactarius psammicola]|nr:hypothetical protein BJY52DRAFT_527790 [Lactarius psammicola]